jgi:hypothetical protein
MTTLSSHVTRLIGPVIAATGILHVGLFLFWGRAAVGRLLRDGVVNAIQDSDQTTVWYGGVMLGVALCLIGLLTTTWTRTTGRPAPRYLGWSMVALGVAGVMVQPASGSALIVVYGLTILLTHRAAA